MRFRLGFLLFFALCVLAFSIYMLASAQEDARVKIKVDEGKNPDDENVMVIQEVQSSGDGESPRVQTFIRRNDGTLINMDGSETSESNIRRFEIRTNSEERQRTRRESGNEMKKDASPDADSAKKMGEKIPNVPKDQAKGTVPQKEQPQAPVPGGDKLGQYLSAISEKNLFLPLGTVKREEKAAYAVTAIISNTSQEAKPKAIIEQMGANKSYYVSEGDNLVGEEKVTDIKEDTVKVNRSGEEMTLKLGIGTQGGGKGSGGAPRGREAPVGPPSGEGKSASRFERQQSSGGPNLDNLPPMVKKMLEERGISIEELKNNPELQQKLREEFQQRFGGQRQEGSGIQMEVRPK